MDLYILYPKSLYHVLKKVFILDFFVCLLCIATEHNLNSTIKYSDLEISMFKYRSMIKKSVFIG